MIKAKIYDKLRRISSYRVRYWFKSQPWFSKLAQWLFGNEVYSKSYYQDVERLEKESVAVLADWIVTALNPGRIIDVGCGPGHLMQALHQRNVDVFGVDVSSASLAIVHEKQLPFQRFDLTWQDKNLPGTPYDLAISCEVAEHLDTQHAPTFMAHLCGAADLIFLTATEPNKDFGIGLMHVNEQPNAYWIDLAARHGFKLDAALTQSARAYFKQHEVIAYLAEPMILVKK